MRLATVAVMLLATLLSTEARADLAADVRKALAAPALSKASIGVQIVRLGQLRDQDEALVSVKADEAFIPASNLKVITTAAAVETLGHDFRFRTRLAMRADGAVALIGDGDPTLGDSDYLARTGWTVTTVFENWAAELKRNGITQVGDVLVDDSIFEDTMMHPSWPLDQAERHYVPQVAGVNFNANCLDVYAIRNANGTAGYRTEPATNYVKVESTLAGGSDHIVHLGRVLGTNRIILRGTVSATSRSPFRVTIHDPSLYAATTLAETLQRSGVTVKGKVKRDRTIRATVDAPSTASSGWRLLAVHETPLMPVLDRTNKDSVNLYAESIAKRVVAATSSQPGSWAGIGTAMASFLSKAGATADGQVFDDGCGLSKKNDVSPASFCATLAYMFHSDHRDAYVKTMAVGGVDGTLSNRYKTSGLAGRVFAKSGSVSGVSALSGYLKTRSGEWYAFSILMNSISDRGAAQRAQDEIVRAIDASSP